METEIFIQRIPDELDERSRRVQDAGAPSGCASVIFNVESLQNEESMII